MASLEYDLVVIGGGPAGSSATITAARAGLRVLLAERGRLPRHKVCGEFVSPEAAGQLATLLKDAALLRDAPRIARARIFLDEQMREAPVDPPALSITRYELDWALWDAVLKTGVDARQQLVIESIRGSGPFVLGTAEGDVRAMAVIDASGRGSNLTAADRRPMTGVHREKWIGLKGHFAESAPGDSVDLYFFERGYCGVQAIGANAVNVCALVRADTARTLPQVFSRNRALWRRSRDWEPLTAPVNTSAIAFGGARPVRDGVLCAGDAAGFVDPFVGDGISLALHSGAMAARCLVSAFQRGEPVSAVAVAYEHEYRRAFLPVFRNAARIRRLFSMPRPVRSTVMAAMRSRHLAGWLVAATRAKASAA